MSSRAFNKEDFNMIYEIEGLKINYREVDLGVIQEVFFEDPYIIKEINEGSIVIDIGAHIGTFALRCAKERDCTVFSYEPNKESYDILIQNIKDNNVEDKIKCFNKALSDKVGTRDFNVSTGHPAGSSFYMDCRPFYTTKVECTTLENVFIENSIDHCRFMKLDCEMEEKTILNSTPDSILDRIDRITLEYHTMQDGEYIKNLLINKGYSVEPNDIPKVERSVLYAKR
jgi:FkbM family methyltransferase